MGYILLHEIDGLKKKLYELCAMVEENFRDAIKSVLERDVALAERIIRNDDRIDSMEIVVEEECLKILALHQPVAIDLRFIVAALKINSDLERMGDLAVNVAERVVQIATYGSNGFEFDFRDMLDKSFGMLKKSVDAFINFDTSISSEVIQADDEVDLLNKNTFAAIINEIKNNPADTGLYLQYLSISRCLERIADHATSIAEDVIYLVDGNIIRHQDKSVSLKIE